MPVHSVGKIQTKIGSVNKNVYGQITLLTEPIFVYFTVFFPNEDVNAI